MFKLKSLTFFLGCLSFLSFPLTVSADTNQESATEYVKGSATTASVKAQLLADADVKSLDISVTTENGVVTLTGFVETQAQSDKASAIAKKVDGVVSVENKLKIRKAQ